jgi:hypothetical protein
MPTVRTLYTAMMVLLAKATDRELARMVSYLKEENRILRARLPERINVTPKERERLLMSILMHHGPPLRRESHLRSAAPVLVHSTVP